MPYKRNLNLSYCQVFFDFDNTIVSFDVLDDIIRRFSVNRDWVRLEKAWEQGKIGSRECLEGQLRSVRISKRGLLKYLSRIKVDPYFPKLLEILRSRGIRPVILSDSFSFIINNILSRNGVKGVKVYSNRLRFFKDRLIPSFPYTDKACRACAHCKKNNLLNSVNNGKVIIYSGDGISDICPAEHADLVFAKGRLLRHFRRIKRNCIAVDNLGGVYKFLRRRWSDSETKNNK